MREKAPQSSGQESLIVAAPLTHEFVVRDFGDTWPAVSLAEHNLQQLHALNLFSTIHEKEHLLRNPGKVAHQYPKTYEQVLQATKEQRTALETETKTEFFRSLGYYAVEDSGLADTMGFDMKSYTKDSERRWRLFQVKYRSVRNLSTRQEEINRLIEAVKDTDEGRTLYNRAHQLRPHAPNKETARRTVEDEKPVPRPLSTQERLVALLEDPRAGYLPVNNSEKNTVLSWLDYFDNPDHPLGIGNQLLEVLVSQQKRQTPTEGIRAMESITWEVGDTVADAVHARELMTTLSEDLEDIAPKVPLAEIEGLDEEAIRYLLRFEAVEHVAKTGKHRGLHDALRVKEDRQVPGGSDPGKHKTIHSHFTAPDEVRPDATNDYIELRTMGLNAQEARKLLKRSIPNEFIRARVALRCLLDIQDSLATLHRAFWPVRTAVTESLVVVADKPIVQLILNERTKQAV